MLQNGDEDDDDDSFSKTFNEVAKQIKRDYKEEKGLVSLVEINCEIHYTLCYEDMKIRSFPAVGCIHNGDKSSYPGSNNFKCWSYT